MAIRTYLTIDEAERLDDAVRRHNVRLRYIVRDLARQFHFAPPRPILEHNADIIARAIVIALPAV